MPDRDPLEAVVNKLIIGIVLALGTLGLYMQCNNNKARPDEIYKPVNSDYQASQPYE